MTDDEKLLNIMKYIYFADTYFANTVRERLNYIIIHNPTEPEPYLLLYKAISERAAYKQIAQNIERIIYDNPWWGIKDGY